MELESLAEKLGIEIVRERLTEGHGGLCRLNKRYLLFIDKKLPVDEQVQLVIAALARFPLDGLQMLPRIRELLEEHRHNKARPGSAENL